MIPSFEDFLATQKLKKYTFSDPVVIEKWGYYSMTMRVTGPRGGETSRTRTYWGMHNRERCAEILRSYLEAAILRKLK